MTSTDRAAAQFCKSGFFAFLGLIVVMETQMDFGSAAFLGFACFLAYRALVAAFREMGR